MDGKPIGFFVVSMDLLSSVQFSDKSGEVTQVFSLKVLYQLYLR